MAGRFPTAGRPSVSQPTPLAARSALRAPIYNPFDKFNAEEFDAWIGDITGQLRRALGQEPLQSSLQKHNVRADVSMFDEEVDEDSFAEIKARRAAKGKQRATYEDLDEDDEDDQEVETSILEDGKDSEEEELNYEESDIWGPANGAEGHSEEDASADELSESDGEGPEHLGEPDAPIEILDSDDDEAALEEEQDKEDEEGHGEYEETEVVVRGLQVLLDDEELDDESEEDEIQEVDSDNGFIEVVDDEANEADFPPRATSKEKTPPPVDIPDPWVGPSTYAEDFYSGGDVPEGASGAHVLPSEVENSVAMDDEDGEFVSTEADEDLSLPPVQLADKWEGPRTYAEDFYAGGDLPSHVARLRTPSHLTPAGTPGVEKETVAEFFTPGVLTPESPPIEPYLDPIGVYDGDVGAPPVEDVPTFSMPPESEHEAKRIESSVGVRGRPQEDSVIETLYIDLGDEPLPEAAQMVPPTPVAPVTDPAAAILDLHERDSSPHQISPKGHVDWNNPLAFSNGRSVLGLGDLESVDNAAFKRDPKDIPATADIEPSSEQEILEISDDEEEPELTGPVPLGTSDLDIPVDATYDEDEGSFSPPEEISADFSAELARILSGEELVARDVAIKPPDLEDEDEISFGELGSRYTNNDAIGSAQDATVAAREPLEPVVEGDTDFGDLPNPPTRETRVDIELDADTSLQGILDVLSVTEELDAGQARHVDELDAQHQLSSDDPIERSAEQGQGAANFTVIADASVSVEPATSQKDALDAAASFSDFEKIYSAIVEDDVHDIIEETQDDRSTSRQLEAVSAAEIVSTSSDDMLHIVEISEGVEDIVSARDVDVEEVLNDESREATGTPGIVGDEVEVATHHGETPAAGDYSIVEEITDNEEETVRAHSVVSDSIEVATHRGETPAVPADFDIEEAFTQGRRTEEPEAAAHIRGMSLTVESVYSPSPIEGTPIDGTNEAGVQPTREDVLPGFAGDKTESSEAAVEDIMTTSEVSEDADAFFGEARDVQQAAKFHPSAAVEEATVAEGRPSEVSLGSESTSTAPVIQIDVHSAHGKLADPPPPESPTTKMLQPGIPMPVSADPTVPDPASVHDSPAESPRSPSSRSVVQHALSAVPPSLLSKLSHPSSLSGLFTPYSEASSGPSSPTLQDSIPTLEDEASKGTSTAAADKDGGRGKDEGEMESPIVSPLAASVEAVYNEDHDADLDADGDIDPDYVEGDVEETVIPTTAAILVPPHPDAPADVPIITETLDDPAPTVAAQAEEQAEVVQLVAEAEEMRAIETPAGMGAKELSPAPEDSSAEPLAPKDSAVKEGEWPSAAGAEEDSPKATETESIPDGAISEPASKPTVPVVKLPIPPTPSRKRKRTTPEPTAPKRLTRSQSKTDEASATPQAPQRSAKSLGKQKALLEIPEEVASSHGEAEGAAVRDDIPSKPKSSASASASRRPSRESSIVSTEPSEFTGRTPSSPALPTEEQVSLSVAFKREGFLRHHHGVPPPPPPPPPPPLVLPVPPAPVSQPIIQPVEVAIAPDEASAPPDVAPPRVASAEPQHAELPAPPQYSSLSTSPVTRSHCRFRKISIRRDKYRHRSYFVVPACSLSNTELMEQYYIKEEGEPTIEDVRRLRSNVEALNIRGFAFLVGILHQLVGKDLDRDLFYLPLPGEKLKIGGTDRKGRISNIDAISSRNGLGLTKKSLSAVKKSPAATAESASAASSPARSRVSIGSSFTNRSISDGEESEEESKRPSKRRRGAAKSASVGPETAGPDQPSADNAGEATPNEDEARKSVPTTSRKPLPTRRSKRLAVDSQAYKPEDESGDHDSEEEIAKVKGRRKRAAPRGTKRSRELSEPTVEKAKKRKTSVAPSDDVLEKAEKAENRKASVTPSNGGEKVEQAASQTSGDRSS